MFATTATRAGIVAADLGRFAAHRNRRVTFAMRVVMVIVVVVVVTAISYRAAISLLGLGRASFHRIRHQVRSHSTKPFTLCVLSVSV